MAQEKTLKHASVKRTGSAYSVESSTSSGSSSNHGSGTERPYGNNYGDLLGATVNFGFMVGKTLPDLQRPPLCGETHPIVHYVIAVNFLAMVALGLYSFFGQKASPKLSAVTLSAFITFMSAQIMSNFPSYEDDSALLARFCWLLIVIAIDFDLGSKQKMCLAGLNLAVGCLTACMDPILAMLAKEERGLLENPVALNMMHLFASTVGFLVIHVGIYMGKAYLVAHLHKTQNVSSPQAMAKSVQSKLDWWTMHMARGVLAFVFLTHVWNEIRQFDLEGKSLTDIGFVIGRVCFLAAVGLAALGVFHRNVDDKDRLETLVQERTKQIHMQQDHLHMVGVALQASETAICITDTHQRIIWLNPALIQLCHGRASSARLSSPSQSKIGQQDVDSYRNKFLVDVLPLSGKDAKNFSGLFDPLATKQEEIMVGKKVIEAEVSPFLSNDTTRHDENEVHDTNCEQHRFVVALKDITEFRALQRAENAAEREALMVKAMTESMETLTHELRTPLQVRTDLGDLVYPR